jgi:iron complex outermembrane receptor protein
MSHKKRVTRALMGAGLMCFCCASVMAEEASDSTRSLQAITVTGERIERSLKDTTSSVSVISEEQLKTTQPQTISDAISEISNVVTLSGAVPDIRGVSGNGAAGGFNSISGGAKARVSTLVDGVAVPFVADLTGDSGLWDVEQIEVFRGPQSTSNGRNSIGGSIIVKTKDPTFDWESEGRLGRRNKNNYIDTAAMVSGPIIEDTLAFRVSAQRIDGETYTSDKEYETNPADYELNELITERLRTKLLWTPSEKLDVLASYSSNNETGDSGRIYYSADDPWKYERIYFRDIETESDTSSVKVGYEFNDNLSVDVLAAYMEYKWGFDTYEASDSAEQRLVFDEQNTTLDAKINLGTHDDLIYGFIGLAYFERSQDIISTGAYIYNGNDESESKAVYGELNYAFTNRLKLIAGGRVEREAQLRHFSYPPIVIDAVLDEGKTITLPKLALQYAVSNDTTIAVSARKGYNAAGGALNFSAGEYYYFDDETVNTYETSIRSSMNDGKVNLSANLFYNDYDGYQALSSTRFIVNMDEVVTYGAEFETFIMLGSNLELTTGLGLLRTEIKDAGEEYPDAKGNELNSAPEITANLGAKLWITHALNVGAAANYVDQFFGDFENTEERIAGNYTLVRLNASYEMDHWLVAAFVNNLFDKKAYLTKEPPGGRYPTGYAAIVDPRTFGISVTYFM